MRFALQYILTLFKDSVATMPSNSPDSVWWSYQNEIKPLGMRMIKFNAMSAVQDTIVLAISVSLPITYAFDKVRFQGAHFIVKLTPQLKFAGMHFVKVDYSRKIYPVDFYGFHAGSQTTVHYVTIPDDVKELVQHNALVHSWSLSGAEFRMDPRAPFELPDTILQPGIHNWDELAYQLSYISDSMIGFSHLPYFYDLKQQRIIDLGHPASTEKYEQVLTAPVKVNGTSYLLLIENLNGVTLLSFLDSETYQRKSIKRIHAVASAFVIGSDLYLAKIPDSGNSYFLKVDLSALL
jgi:hypothetical protein